MTTPTSKTPNERTPQEDAEAGTLLGRQAFGCLKVAFIGSHGVGKTTLCFELAAALKRRDLHVDVVKEVARRCPLPINKETSLEAQAWILHTQMAMEIEAASQHEAIVCDRSVLDNYAYLVASCGRQPEYHALVRSWIRSYTAIFWVPILDGPRFDGVRDTDRRYQERIEELITQLSEEFQVPAIQLHDTPRDRWIERVLSALPLDDVQLPLFREDPS
ncbi:MAG: AAA family ATPase [Candidatus Eisenbacteria bacterium]